MLNTKALSYMNCVVLSLIKRYNLSEVSARKAVKESYLFESLHQNPEEAMHDSINTSADDVYAEVYGNKWLTKPLFQKEVIPVGVTSF